MPKTFYVYILTNWKKTVLYTGMTNNLSRRLGEHDHGVIVRNRKAFSGRYKCRHLVWYEEHPGPWEAIEREKQIKKWRREKKVRIIEELNPKWEFLEGHWQSEM